MKRAMILLIFLATTACLTQKPTVIPVDTVVALTMAAMPPTNTLIPTETATATPLISPTSPTDFNPSIVGVSCIPANTERTRGVVSSVIDGESIEVSINNVPYRVRYIGIKAPGISPQIEWQGPQAVAANENLTSGKFVTLIKDVSETDERGFLLRYVVTDDAFINYEMIRSGYARAFIIPPDILCDSVFMDAQTQAQAAKLGVWLPTPIPTATITSTPTITFTPQPTRTPTATLFPACDCNRKYTCNNFTTQESAQACYDYCGALDKDVGLVDKNGNGKVCESLP